MPVPPVYTMIDAFIVLFRFPEREHPAGSFRLSSPGVMLSHLRNTEELPQSASPRGSSSSSGPDLSSPLYLLPLRLEKLQAALTPSLVSNCLETCYSRLTLWRTEPHLLSSTQKSLNTPSSPVASLTFSFAILSSVMGLFFEKAFSAIKNFRKVQGEISAQSEVCDHFLHLSVA